MPRTPTYDAAEELDLTQATGRFVSVLRAAGASNIYRLANETELEYRRLLVARDAASVEPRKSAVLDAYARAADDEGFGAPLSSGLEVPETVALYRDLFPYGNPLVFHGHDVPLSGAKPYRERVAATAEIPAWNISNLRDVDIEALRNDEASQEPVKSETTRTTVAADGTIATPKRMAYKGVSGATWSFFKSNDFLAPLEEAVGRRLFLNRASFLNYDDGDHLGIHTDGPYCKYVILMSLYDETPPLTLHPEFRGITSTEVLNRLQGTAGHPDSNLKARITSQPLLMRGAELPHSRERHAGEKIRLATACFDTLA
ncbi:hypothetical protein [Curtobacterium flaccumfaciens]|uniref:hypothetical protein n=1 Tax=Curtobacterium flaccumfaciens TaxID=2035 RepID=UPI001BDEE9F1|nr:hypothetical protein [Curtobacterium flaccumfaciens]MBT1672838.1 hypothetical protein [Curtobacterium flaccumfaciens pv. flaccumfaciens]